MLYLQSKNHRLYKDIFLSINNNNKKKNGWNSYNH